MKVSLIQINAQADKAANLKSAKEQMEKAIAADGPDMVIVPEYFTHLDGNIEDRHASGETIPGGETYLMLQDMAVRHGVYVHGGSYVERDGDQYYNTTVAFDRKGNQLAKYRKIHLFDVVTPDGIPHLESKGVSRGNDIVTYDIEGARVGCSICYDLRFPELYQALFKAGATIIMVPSAFQLLTGKDHWEVLLRARAIETETYVIAPGQIGPNTGGKNNCYGHSMVIDPWGHVIAKAKDTVGFVTATLDFEYQKSVRAKVPVADHKVL
jgi:deaminated glutathione amidase